MKYLPLLLLTTSAMGLAPLFSYAQETPKSITLTADRFTFTLPLAQVEEWQHTEFSSFLDPLYRSEWENPSICHTKEIECTVLLSSRMRIHRRVIATSDIQTSRIASYLDTLKQQTDTPVTESSIKPTENPAFFVFHRGEPGIGLPTESNLSILKDIARNPTAYLEKPVGLVFDKIHSPLSSEAKALGLTAKVGEGISNFKGSTKNRIFNIQHALERFNAVLIKPGETFSFTATLGPVEESTGYREELVIRNNATELEYGGGICQVSTTFFRAAVNSGLEILSRRNHSYPVSYYKPIGFDATVYYPKPDLLIKNNFTHNILFVPYIDGLDLHFEVYGTPDGREVNVTLPVVTERRDDGGLKTQFTQIVKDKDGKTLIDQTFKSNYDSPDKYPHPGEEPIYTTKPKDWSKRQWEAYKKTHNV